MLELPHGDDEDDDSHLCIKCNATIIGLDNYVRHRRESCLKSKFHVGADVFFQSLELQSSSKRHQPILTTEKKKKLGPQASVKPIDSPFEQTSHGEDWIGGHSLRVTGNDDNQTKLIKAVANISELPKKDIAPYQIIDDYRHHDDDSNEDSDDSDDMEEEDHHKPPPSHTGGKWRPTYAMKDEPHNWCPTPLAITELQEEWDITEQSTENWSHDREEEEEEDAYMPPPGHTKGKWIPGAGKSTHIMDTSSVLKKGVVQYWCGPCNRRLGSKTIYMKHLLSNLHLKKIRLESDLEYSGQLEPSKNLERLGKRTPKPSPYVNDSIYTSKIRNVHNQTKKKRISKFTRCAVCKSRVKTILMGKHLISHYHFRKTNFNKELHIKLVLENIEAIVHQHPFQCASCKFYASHESNFLNHWNSESHAETVSRIDGNYWCAFCKFECAAPADIYNHLIGNEHSEVVAAINRSMPIILRKKRILNCGSCTEIFRYNVEVKRHSKVTGHPLSGTASDSYQCFEKCLECGISVKSARILAQHIKRDHNHDYVCSTCNLTFERADQAKQHRRTQSHKYRFQEKVAARGLGSKELSRICAHCNQKFENVEEMKKHLNDRHPDVKHKCPKCGMEFAISQEVSRHIRTNACKFDGSQHKSESLWSCSRCHFQTDSQAECFFHEALHLQPTKITEVKDGSEIVIEKYSCPVCGKMFRKPSLRCHIRLHTYERPFACDNCSSTFARKNNLVTHLRIVHGVTVSKRHSSEGTSSLPPIEASVQSQDASYSCSHPGCRYATNKMSDLKRHTSSVHSGQRNYRCQSCQYSAKTQLQLKRHAKLHDKGRQKHYECIHCEFKTDQSYNLKRHERLHSGEKPYKCPHCEYKCNNLENLRKHVIETSIHHGKRLYTCSDCDSTEVFQSNFAREYKAHLTSAHPLKYNSKSASEEVTNHCWSGLHRFNPN